MDRIYDDQPLYETSKKKKVFEEDIYKKEIYIPFVPQEPKSEEYMAQQRNEFAHLLTKPQVKLDKKAIEYAVILLQGFNKD